MLDVLAAGLATSTVMAMIAGQRRPEKAQLLAGLTGLIAAVLLTLALLAVDEPVRVLSTALACLMLGILLGAARERRGDPSDTQLQSHLARCRRRGESASVLVVALSDAVGKNATQALRVTDSAAVKRVGKRWELHALLDKDDVPRHVVEQRLALAVSGSPVFGWATFPNDGLTLEALFEHARAETRRAVTAPETRHADGRSRTPDDPAAAS